MASLVYYYGGRRWRWSTLFNNPIKHYMQKNKKQKKARGEEGEILGCENAYVTNGRPLEITDYIAFTEFVAPDN